MDVLLYKDIGKKLANQWGYQNRIPLKSLIEKMDDKDAMACCLLAAVVDLLQDIKEQNHRDRQLKKVMPSRPQHPVADGYLEWLGFMGSDVPITRKSTFGLSVRARKALARGGFKRRSEVTRKRLDGLPNCGAVTTEELLAWAGNV